MNLACAFISVPTDFKVEIKCFNYFSRSSEKFTGILIIISLHNGSKTSDANSCRKISHNLRGEKVNHQLIFRFHFLCNSGAGADGKVLNSDSRIYQK